MGRFNYYTRKHGVTDQAVFAPVHALVNDYLQSDRTSAWDFETKIKAAVTRAVGPTKITWFVHNLGIRTSEINVWRNRFDEIRRGDQAAGCDGQTLQNVARGRSGNWRIGRKPKSAKNARTFGRGTVKRR